METIDYKTLLLQLIGSLMYCDHMGDVSNDVDTVLKKLNIEYDSESDEGEWGNLNKILYNMKITTLYGTPLWYPEDEGYCC